MSDEFEADGFEEIVIDPRTPILVGGGHFTQRTAQQGKFAEGMKPLEMLTKAAKMAAEDSGIGDAALAAVDTIAVVRFTVDSAEAGRLPVGQMPNPPRSLAKAIGATPKREIYTAAGGNTPQALVNSSAEDIANGKADVVLLAGCEYLATLLGALKAGVKLDAWGDDEGGEPEKYGDYSNGVNAYEHAHGMRFPVNTYPLFENAIRGSKNRSVAFHQKKLGNLFRRFNVVASTVEESWFPKPRSAEEIATPTEKNRYVGFPYTKYMNAVIEVDQAAAVLMMSVEKAQELGVPEDRWVFLHGCADVKEIWNVSERPDLSESPAIKLMAREVMAMSKLSIGDIDHMDLYSCFPSAVEYALDAFGIAADDERGLTVTGGLPYFGGAGNNYVMHSIVMMLHKVREDTGSFGLVTGNGWFATKHAAGIYSTEPTEGPWTRRDPQSYQSEIDAIERPKVAVEANGKGTIETYTVVHDRTGPMLGIVIGRLEDNSRFVANTPADRAVLDDLMSREGIGRTGTVRHEAGKNVFTPDAA